MKSRYAIALSLLSMGTLAGCVCTGKPSSGPVIPIAEEPTTECTSKRPDSVVGPTGNVTAGTYCVCNAGGHGDHGGYKGPHLAKGQTIVISPVDLVTDVQFGAVKVPMILSEDKRQLTGLLAFGHEKTAGGAVTVNHLVQIRPVAVNEDETPGCSASTDRNSLKITFCARNEDDGKWACGKGPGYDYGDTHVQN